MMCDYNALDRPVQYKEIDFIKLIKVFKRLKYIKATAGAVYGGGLDILRLATAYHLYGGLHLQVYSRHGP